MGYSPQGCKESDTTEATQHKHMSLKPHNTVTHINSIHSTSIWGLLDEELLREGLCPTHLLCALRHLRGFDLIKDSHLITFIGLYSKQWNFDMVSLNC